MRPHDNHLESEWISFLTLARQANGIQQNFVAHKIGTYPAHVGQWEALDRSPKTFTLWNRWASFFGVGPVIGSPYRREKIIKSLRAERKAQGVAMPKLADRLGVSKERVSQWENRKSGPSTFRLWNLWAELLGLDAVIASPPDEIPLLFGINGELGYDAD